MLQVTELLLPHWSYVSWNKNRWPNFEPWEFASRDGQFYYWPEFNDRLQAARGVVGRPFYITSGHRSWRDNIRVGGAPMSEHKRLAVDISLHNQDRFYLLSAMRGVGFKGFGLYKTFLHVDLGDVRAWYGEDAEEYWR